VEEQEDIVKSELLEVQVAEAVPTVVLQQPLGQVVLGIHLVLTQVKAITEVRLLEQPICLVEEVEHLP